MTIAESFRLGWEYGRQTGRVPTAREAADRWPDAATDCVVQGAIDGTENDRGRLDMDTGEG